MTKGSTTPKEKQTKKSNGHFSEKETQMAIKHLKSCSTLFMINKTQIKTAMKEPFSPIRFSIIQKLTKMRSNRHSHTLSHAAGVNANWSHLWGG